MVGSENEGLDKLFSVWEELKLSFLLYFLFGNLSVEVPEEI